MDQQASERTAQIAHKRNLVFISYSHQDKKWLDQLLISLKPGIQQDLLELWDDTKIQPGANWEDEIEGALAAAKVAVLLVSPHFLASDYIVRKEIPALLKAAEKEGLTVLWIAVSDSCWGSTSIAEYQAAHDPSRPLNSLSPAKRDRAWRQICEKIIMKGKNLLEENIVGKPDTKIEMSKEHQLLLCGYICVEQAGQESILIRDIARLPILEIYTPQEDNIEQAINKAVLALFTKLGISTDKVVEAGFSRPFYRRLYRINGADQTLNQRPCIFFTLSLNRELYGTSLIWKQRGYRWAQKADITAIWHKDFRFGQDDDEERSLEFIDDPYEAITKDWVSLELNLKVLECVDMLIFRKTQEEEIEFLFIQRRNNRGWEYPKGGLFYHETPLEGALREIAEETGIETSMLQYCGYLDWQTADVRERKRFYDTLRVHGLTFCYHGDPHKVKLDASHNAYAWFPFKMARDSIWVPYGAEFFKRWDAQKQEILQNADKSVS
jgi:8-oxo-dGTP pyrophosphatase MutT (NUDIX family)